MDGAGGGGWEMGWCRGMGVGGEGWISVFSPIGYKIVAHTKSSL